MPVCARMSVGLEVNIMVAHSSTALLRAEFPIESVRLARVALAVVSAI